MGFIAWLFGSKPSIRIDGFEPMVARAFVVMWSANFELTRSSLRVDRFDSIYLGTFESMKDTSSWLVDPVGSNEASQVSSNKASVMGSNKASPMASNNRCLMGSNLCFSDGCELCNLSMDMRPTDANQMDSKLMDLNRGIPMGSKSIYSKVIGSNGV